jgi:uncharacterized membrane protein YfcA
MSRTPVILLSPFDHAMLLAAGLACGLLNTLASSGSAITLPLLLSLGLDPVATNATNRLPVVVCAMAAVAAFYRKSAMDWPLLARLAPAVLVGTMAGVVTAQALPPREV